MATRNFLASASNAAVISNSAFAVHSKWQAVTSGSASVKLAVARHHNHSVLRVDFDFANQSGSGGGFVVARRVLSQPMPAHYALRLRLRGPARGARPANHLEIKLVDASGYSVWRHVIHNLRPTTRWKTLTIPDDAVEFAWGPAGGGSPEVLGALEFAIVCVEGGRSSLWISDFEIIDLGEPAPPLASASSGTASEALSPRGWLAQADDDRCELQLDFPTGEHAAIKTPAGRLFGGLSWQWPEGAPVDGFSVEVLHAKRWSTAYQTQRARGSNAWIYLPNTQAEALRVRLSAPARMANLQIEPVGFAKSIHSFFHAIAERSSRGSYPRWVHREQSLWTPIGAAAGHRCALLNEEGAVEPDEACALLEPWVYCQGRWFSWADVSIQVSLQDGWQPVPTVCWSTPDWQLTITGEATISGQPIIRYAITSNCAEPLEARLILAIRPFQLTPPWQAIRDIGGVSPIHTLKFSNNTLWVNDTPRYTVNTPSQTFSAQTFSAQTFSAWSFAEGDLRERLHDAAWPARNEISDDFGFANGVMAFDLTLHGPAPAEIGIHCIRADIPHTADNQASVNWPALLAPARWQSASWGAAALTAMHTAAAHVLMTRDGPALQPGPRRYSRAWIRDGAMMSMALLRMGRIEEVRDFIRWYAPHQRADGFVPCCVDRNGPDWLVEHDSHGQWLSLIAEYLRFSGDFSELPQWWDSIQRAVKCIADLLEPEDLLPISASHEGYLAQPVHSYWDGFWALRGVRDALALAQRLNKAEQIAAWQALAERIDRGLQRSIAAVRAAKQLDFVPGSLEWADLDPTATANAVMLFGPAAVAGDAGQAALNRTMDLHLATFRQRRDGQINWANYSPYEIRIIGALVRLNRREDALELLRYYLSQRRPLAWNQWPEIAWRDALAPANIGDIPHTWISAEYIWAVRSLFVYEQTDSGDLVIGAGIDPAWLADGGIRLDRIPTAWGALSVAMRYSAPQVIQVQICTPVTAHLRPPLTGPVESIRIQNNAGEVNALPHGQMQGNSLELPAGDWQVWITLAGTANT